MIWNNHGKSIAAALGILAMSISPAVLYAQEHDHSEHEHDTQEQTQEETGEHKEMKSMMQAPPRQRGYMEAHKGVENPKSLLGGPLEVTVKQDFGGVHVALPAQRKLDPAVFGTPENPAAYEGAPLVTGVPVPIREVENGEFTQTKKMTPFGQKNVVMGNGKLNLKAVDRQATDGATTKDSIQFSASWKDKEGNTYSVKCNKVAPHGVQYPSFGGVVTNHVLHGWSGIGTPLMPTEFAYVAFWGMGTVSKNGEVVDGPRPVHGMLTEYVRKEEYGLAFDHEVTPTRMHFHLMVAPVKPHNGGFEHSPVKTGFNLPNGKELPFWHVMFANLDIDASRQ